MLRFILLIDEAVEASHDFVAFVVVVAAVFAIVHALLAVVLSVCILVLVKLHDSDLASATLATALLLAVLQALEKSSPLEVKEGHEHEGETYVDGDDHGPVREVFFGGVQGNDLMAEFEVTLGALLRIAVGHNPNLVCALEGKFLADLCHNIFLCFWLVHPEVRVERAEEVHFATLGQHSNLHINSLRHHFGPDVGLLRVLPRLVLEQVHAGALWLINSHCLLCRSHELSGSAVTCRPVRVAIILLHFFLFKH